MPSRKRPSARQTRAHYRPRIELVDGSLIEALCDAEPRLAVLRLIDLRTIVWMIAEHEQGNRPHKSWPGQCSYWPHWLLDAVFEGRGHFAHVNRIAGCPWIVTKFGNAEKRVTRKYQLASRIKTALAAYRLPPVYVDRPAPPQRRPDGERILTLPRSVASKDASGRSTTLWQEIPPPANALAGDWPLLRRLYAVLSAHADGRCEPGIAKCLEGEGITPKTAKSRASYAEMLLTASNNTICPGFVPHRYEHASTGRLVARHPNFQNAPCLVRAVALHGLFDTDIENCHYVLLAHYCRKFEIPHDAIALYNADKSGTRQRIAEAAQLSIDDTKTALIAPIYGAPVSPSSRCELGRGLGWEPIKRLRAVSEYMAIVECVKGCGVELYRAFPRPRGRIQNALGIWLKLAGHSWAEALSHMLQGAEALLLREAMRLCPVLLPTHDGFLTGGPVDTDWLSRKLLSATDFKVSLECGQLSLPQWLRVLFAEEALEPPKPLFGNSNLASSASILRPAC